MNKILVLLLLMLSASVTLVFAENSEKGKTEDISKEKKNDAVKGEKKVKIDLSTQEVVEITVEVDSPPYVGTDTLKITYNPGNEKAEVVYSGLVVQGQGGRSWQERNKGVKKIPVAEFKKIVGLINEKSGWYIEMPSGCERPSSGSAWHLMTIKLFPRGKDQKNLKTIVVADWYYKDKNAADEFREIVIAIGNLYKENFGVEFYNPAHYD